MLVCISPLRSGFPPLGALPNFTLYRDFPHLETQLCCKNFSLSESQVHSSVVGSHSHSKAYVIPTPLLGFPHSEAKFAGTADETTPTQEQCCKLTKPFPCQIKHSEIKGQHSEEGARTQIPKANGKTIHARSK